jgi:hypothetical protein
MENFHHKKNCCIPYLKKVPLTVLLSLEKWKIFITKKISASHIEIDISFKEKYFFIGSTYMVVV